MAKIYAVRKGHKTGVFDTWEECEKQVKGYPDAEFRSFPNLYDAEIYLGLIPEDEISLIREEPPERNEKLTAHVYVDGSFNKKTGVYGYGVIFVNDKSTYLGSGYKESLASMRNVAGEILGAQKAIEVAIEKGYKTVVVYHDYTGIAQWALGSWKTNKPDTQAYRQFILEKQKQIDIQFVKVDAHTGVEFNEMADRLAKDACGVK